jgi:hypothetical protein
VPFCRTKTTDAPKVQTQNGKKAALVTIPLADQNAAGSLVPYAESAATRTRTEPIQPASASQRGRILVAAPREPAAPRKNAADLGRIIDARRSPGSGADDDRNQLNADAGEPEHARPTDDAPATQGQMFTAARA